MIVSTHAVACEVQDDKQRDQDEADDSKHFHPAGGVPGLARRSIVAVALPRPFSDCIANLSNKVGYQYNSGHEVRLSAMNNAIEVSGTQQPTRLDRQ